MRSRQRLLIALLPGERLDLGYSLGDPPARARHIRPRAGRVSARGRSPWR